MGWRIMADVTMTAHFGFLLYVALGGFLAWKWRWMLIPHFGAAAYGAGTVLIGWPCPLTGWEDEFRARAGDNGIEPAGFIDHYLDGVVYPQGNVEYAQAAAAVVVAISWFGLIWWSKRQRRRQEIAESEREAEAPDH